MIATSAPMLTERRESEMVLFTRVRLLALTARGRGDGGRPCTVMG